MWLDDTQLKRVDAARRKAWPPRIKILAVFGSRAYCEETADRIRVSKPVNHYLVAWSSDRITVYAEALPGIDCFLAVSVSPHTSVPRYIQVQRPVNLTIDASMHIIELCRDCCFGSDCSRCAGSGRVDCRKCGGSGIWQPRLPTKADRLPRAIGGLCSRCRGTGFLLCPVCKEMKHTRVRLFRDARRFGRIVRASYQDLAPQLAAPERFREQVNSSRAFVDSDRVGLINPKTGRRLGVELGAENIVRDLKDRVTRVHRRAALARGVEHLFWSITGCLDRSLVAQFPSAANDLVRACVPGDSGTPRIRTSPLRFRHIPLRPVPSEITQMDHVDLWCSPWNCDHPVLAAMNNPGTGERRLPHVSLFNARIAQHRAQQTAVRLGMSDEPLVLVKGPPGTGKTTVIVEIVRQCAVRGWRVLVASQTHQAVRNVMERLSNVQGIRMARWATNAEKLSALERACHAIRKGEARQERDAPHDDPNVFFSTCVGLASWKHLTRCGRASIDLVIIDEAAHATIPESLVPLVYAKRVMLIGDEMQLPPLLSTGCPCNGGDRGGVRGVVAETQLRVSKSDAWHLAPLMAKCWLERSLFEWVWWERPDVPRVMLDEQFRMHPRIAQFVSRVFYEGRLKSGVSPKARELGFGRFTAPLCLIPTSHREDRFEQQVGSSYLNQLEAAIVLSVLKEAEGHLDRPLSFGVITPYSAQAAAIRHAVSGADSKFRRVQLGSDDIASVDSFQGSERDVIVISMTRSRRPCPLCSARHGVRSSRTGCAACGGRGRLGTGLSFLRDLRRMNVAFSRAKRMLIVVGDICAVAGRGGNGADLGGRVVAEFERYVNDKGQVLWLSPRVLSQPRGRWPVSAHGTMSQRDVVGAR